VCLHEGPADAFRELRAQDFLLGGPILRHQCPACYLVFGSQRMLRMEPEALGREYREAYAVYDEGDTTPYGLEAFACLGASPGPGRNYLDYGAGRWSRAIPTLRAQGYDVVGFEPYAHDVSGTPEVFSDEARLRSMRFDGIMTQSVIEHLPDPVSTLRFLAGLLRDDGAPMVHATACYRYELEFSRFHLFFFLGRSVAALAARAGLRVEETGNPNVRRFYRLPRMRPPEPSSGTGKAG
jgi:hypothetical protein